MERPYQSSMEDMVNSKETVKGKATVKQISRNVERVGIRIHGKNVWTNMVPTLLKVIPTGENANKCKYNTK